MDENDDEQNENHRHLLPQSISNEDGIGDNDDDEEKNWNDNFEPNFNENEEIESDDSPPINEQEQSSTENDSSAPTSNSESRNSIDKNEKEKDETSTNDVQQTNEQNSSKENIMDSTISSPIHIEINSTIVSSENDVIPSPFTSSISLDQLLNLEPSNDKDNVSKSNDLKLFYDFKPENFHAEQGSPYVCTTCNGVGHLKAQCPELVLPSIIDLPSISDKWIAVLSSLCHQITKRFKPTKEETDNRRLIIDQLERQIRKDYPNCRLHAFGSYYNGFGFGKSDLDVCIVFQDNEERKSNEVICIMHKVLRTMKISNAFENLQPILQAKVPIIRSTHRKFHIEVDISLHNMLAIENTKLLKTYSNIDPRVPELGYMIKHLAKFCRIGDASRGTLSSYAYIIMLIYFLQQTKPAVLPVLQKLNDGSTSMYKKCSKWNVYFYDDLDKINKIWKTENKLSTGALWIEFLRFYTENFNDEEHIVTIRQIEPLFKQEKGWFKHTLAIEDPFELSHNLAGGLSPRCWTMIRRVFIRARQQFGIQIKDIDITKTDITVIEDRLFNIMDLCPSNARKCCPWCQGSFHPRKFCPKLSQLDNENEKKKRSDLDANQRSSRGNKSANMSNNSHNNSNDHSKNGQKHPKSATVTHSKFPFSNDHGWKENPNFNQRKINNDDRSHRKKSGCFICGDPKHKKADCPSSRKNVSN